MGKCLVITGPVGAGKQGAVVPAQYQFIEVFFGLANFAPALLLLYRNMLFSGRVAVAGCPTSG
jgi:hypothetical protein